VIGAIQEGAMITSFVFVMMLVIEYLNVLTRGRWRENLARRQSGQYLLAAVLGVLPGCLGSYAVVSLYAHGIVSFGALVTTMIATAGDESFVMLALMPEKALVLFAILFVLGLGTGWLVDRLFGKGMTLEALGCEGFEVHEEEVGACFPRGRFLAQLRQCSLARGTLCAVLALFLFTLVTGSVGPSEWNWIRVTLLLVSVIGLFIVTTVSDHFLEEHLWKHVARRHVPKIFLWTVGALVVLELLTQHAHVEAWIQHGRLEILLVACLIGIIPESGPHLIFVTMYVEGLVPFSVLLASSIVQDGHAMLPLLAHTRKGFVVVKLINFLVGLTVGLIGYFGKW
jgi:hypothetical protein